MITFFITQEQRRRAQARAVALDICRSNPPGRHPFVWDNRLNSVIRWYDYGSSENKIGAVSFELAQEFKHDDNTAVEYIKCTTRVFHRPLHDERLPRQTTITNLKEHWFLLVLFCDELLPNPDARAHPIEMPPSDQLAHGT